MIKVTLFFVHILLAAQLYGQAVIQTKEIKITYSNGYEVFKVCTSNVQTIFNDKKEYFWYTEYSKIKSTKGGSGGNLLHGNYKFYDENGNLRYDKNYYLGLRDGSEKHWDSSGNIVSQAKYLKGDLVYTKFQNEEKYWIEFIGPMFKEGTIRKVYTRYNGLISEEIMLPNWRQHVKIFYEYSGKLEEEYTAGGIDKERLLGKFSTFYENGKTKIEGQFDIGKYTYNIRVGTWKWFKSDGTLEATADYKVHIEQWSNGAMKIAGGYILDPNTNTWEKTGEWRWYDEDGKSQTSKKYTMGTETED